MAKNPSGRTPSDGAATNVASGDDASGGVLKDGGLNVDATPECRQSPGRVQATLLLRFEMTRRTVVVALGIALTLGCKSSSTRASAQAEPSAVLMIARITPDSGPAGPAYPIEITIEGTGFDSSNVVMFGPLTVKDVPSRESRTRIVMYVPKEMPSSSEVPPSPLLPGPYEVRVKTSAGTSNALTFRLIGSTP